MARSWNVPIEFSGVEELLVALVQVLLRMRVVRVVLGVAWCLLLVLLLYLLRVLLHRHRVIDAVTLRLHLVGIHHVHQVRIL